MMCKDMGGPCDEKISAETPEEMMKEGKKHIMNATDKAHMEIARQMDMMTPEENKEWEKMFRKKWNATKES